MTALVRVTSPASNARPWASWSSVWSGDGYPMWLRRTSRLGLSVTVFAALSAALERVEVVGDGAELDDVPAVGAETSGDVVAVGELGVAVDRDVVVVVDGDELAEAEVAGERCGLVRHAFHEAAVAGDHERVVVDGTGAEALAEDALGERHADRVGEALPERAGGDLDACGVPGLGMTWRGGTPLAEGLDVVELEAVAGEVEHRVLEDRRVPVGEHEPVAVGPVRIGGIVLHHPAVEHVCQRGEGHGGALVAAVRGEWGVHREATDEADGLLVLFRGERRHRG